MKTNSILTVEYLEDESGAPSVLYELNNNPAFATVKRAFVNIQADIVRRLANERACPSHPDKQMKRADKKFAQNILAIAEGELKTNKSMTTEQKRAFRKMARSARAALKPKTPKK